MGNDPKTAKAPGPVAEEYIQANLWVWGFLALLAVIAFFSCGAVWDEITRGVMEFLFGIMGGGFVLVSALDYFYERQRSNLTEKRP